MAWKSAWPGPCSALRLYPSPLPTCTYTVIWGCPGTYLHAFAKLVPPPWHVLSALMASCFAPHALGARLTLSPSGMNAEDSFVSKFLGCSVQASKACVSCTVLALGDARLKGAQGTFHRAFGVSEGTGKGSSQRNVTNIQTEV